MRTQNLSVGYQATQIGKIINSNKNGHANNKLNELGQINEIKFSKKRKGKYRENKTITQFEDRS